MTEITPGQLIQIVGRKEVEIIALRERVQTLEAALAVASRKSEPEPEYAPEPEEK